MSREAEIVSFKPSMMSLSVVAAFGVCWVIMRIDVEGFGASGIALKACPILRVDLQSIATPASCLGPSRRPETVAVTGLRRPVSRGCSH